MSLNEVVEQCFSFEMSAFNPKRTFAWGGENRPNVG
jgi:hypothetical protein